MKDDGDMKDSMYKFVDFMSFNDFKVNITKDVEKYCKHFEEFKKVLDEAVANLKLKANEKDFKGLEGNRLRYTYLIRFSIEQNR